MKLQPEEVELVVYWCLGFAFTGFKLIEEPFVKLLAELLSNQADVACPVVFNTLKFMNFKMSRKYPISLQAYL